MTKSALDSRKSETYNYDRFHFGAYRHDEFPGPKVGEEASDFVAETLHGRRVRLSEYRGRPVVLETGSYTCPIYVGKIDRMNELARRCPEAVFLTLYVREAHPGSRVPQHGSVQDKHALARRTRNEESEGREILVDDLDGTAHRTYGSMPNSVYVFDRNGTVVLRGEWNEPGPVEEALRQLKRGGGSRRLDTSFRPPSPVTLARVLRRAGSEAVADFLVALPRLILYRLKHLFRSNV